MGQDVHLFVKCCSPWEFVDTLNETMIHCIEKDYNNYAIEAYMATSCTYISRRDMKPLQIECVFLNVDVSNDEWSQMREYEIRKGLL